jgi:hypothetical protein
MATKSTLNIIAQHIRGLIDTLHASYYIITHRRFRLTIFHRQQGMGKLLETFSAVNHHNYKNCSFRSHECCYVMLRWWSDWEWRSNKRQWRSNHASWCQRRYIVQRRLVSVHCDGRRTPHVAAAKCHDTASFRGHQRSTMWRNNNPIARRDGVGVSLKRGASHR